MGFEIEPFAMRRQDEQNLLSAADRTEAQATTALLPVAPLALVRAHAATFARSPGGYLRTLAAALAEGGLDARALARQAGCFALAAIVVERLRASGARHIHTHFAGTPSHVTSLVARLGNATCEGKPWTWSVTVHGPVEFFDVGEYRLRKRAREAEFVAYVSEFARDQLLATLDTAQWPKLHLVRCGLDADEFAANGRRPRRDDRPIEILTVGRHVHVKAQAVMIEAVAALIERGVAAHLTLIGDGPLHDDLRRLAAELDLGEAVTFAGALGQDDIPRHLREADVFCLSSAAESLPVVLMEAMASGLPVVSTDVGGIAELVEDGVSGYLTPSGDVGAFADALERLAGDAELRERMGAAGRERVRSDFDVQNSTAELARLLESV
jgi:glycosyltransferase involved in cell wall biosynthesis